MAKKSKIKKHISQSELPDFLRKIADALEHGASEDDAYLVVIEGFKKLKINIRNEFGHTAVKVTAKPLSTPVQYSPTGPDGIEAVIDNASHADELGKLKYKSLKKRMKSSFKTIFSTIHAGSLPPTEAVKEFIAYSHLMVEHEGYGDDYYDEYIAACDAFQDAVNTEDLKAAHKACDELNSIKAHCHAQHK
ncbi:GAK system XXXCH domain-containing protein [Maridesulfovibrio hydrothermalis]|uniref:GAK system XXXCH domain-containing protein n=1 Tax=Maridesulfovibrio hydrothermalis AM13 = DSM 14728 TaxID=1121451 RepID=L0RAK6_9BACT|nr:GAK system XXXCH domain-containing protein [Maridesulfovibrio hydrothermalis]CCO23808.1 conserved protein of unknown function [Maridesulfovibrio hydrothermalis AM13 = DSM 14728]